MALRLPSRQTGAVACLFVIVLLVWGVSCLCGMWQSHRRERREYAMLADCKDPLLFEDFIAKYPGSKRIPDVRRRYYASLAERPRLENFVMNATRDELQTFISSNSGHISLLQLANERIDTMDWRSATEGASMRSMEKYMQEHPEGAFYSVAEVQYRKYERMQIEAELQARLEAEARAAEEADTFSLEFAGSQVM